MSWRKVEEGHQAITYLWLRPLRITSTAWKNNFERLSLDIFEKNWDKFLKKAMLTFTKFTKILVFCKMDSAKLVVSVLGNFIL